jgi:hypothetical protein
MNNTNSHLPRLAATFFLTALLAGCGGGNGNSDQSPPPPPIDQTPAGPPPPPPAPSPAPTPEPPPAPPPTQTPVGTAPVIVTPPIDRTVSAGAMTSFSVTSLGQALTYQWRRNGEAIAGATASTYGTVPATADDGARFDVVVSNAGGSVTSGAALLHVNAPSSRTPVGTHPRLWVQADDLPRLRGWATSANPMFGGPSGGALYQLAVTARDRVESGAIPRDDNGGSTYTPYATESYAALLAFMSLVDTDATRNARWVADAKTALFAVIDQADLGVGSGKFRSDGFASSDRGRWHGESFPLAVDWLYPSLTAAEKQRIRRVFLRWCTEDRDGYPSVTYYHSNPSAVPSGPARRNNPALLDLQDPKRHAIRYSMNNYLMAHARNMFMMANAIDPADDVADPVIPGDAAGRLGDFMQEAIGTYLYMTDYAFRNDGFGGISPEGMEYGESIGFYYGLMLAIHTSGIDDTIKYGDKVSLVNHPFLGNLLPGFFHSLTTRKVATPYGSAYQPSWFGDAEQLYLQDPMRVMGPLSMYARAEGRTADLNAAKWLEYVAPPNNPGSLALHANNDDNIIQSIFYFLMFDPGQAAPADPRSNMPTMHFAPSLGRLQARTSWNDGADVSLVDTKLSYNSIDHQHGDGNMLDFWRKGEWLTKEISAYGAGAAMSEFKNTLAIQNNPVARVGSYHTPFLSRGSQFILGAHDGDPRILAYGAADDYVLMTGDATNLYNFSSDGASARDVTHASRSLLWLKPDVVVLFDRASTSADGRFKRFWLNLPSNGSAPVTAGATTVATTPGGQRLTVSTLLPEAAGADIALVGPDIDMPDQFWKASLDPMSASKSSWTGAYRLRVQAAGHPRTANFLHVLQGSDAGVAAKVTSLIRSDSGLAMTGASIGRTVVMFPDDVYAAPVEASFLVPTATVRVLVTGLTPGGAYTLAIASEAGHQRVDFLLGGSLRANELGVLASP